jgi:hypothetical protein
MESVQDGGGDRGAGGKGQTILATFQGSHGSFKVVAGGVTRARVFVALYIQISQFPFPSLFFAGPPP